MKIAVERFQWGAPLVTFFSISTDPAAFAIGKVITKLRSAVGCSVVGSGVGIKVGTADGSGVGTGVGGVGELVGQ